MAVDEAGADVFAGDVDDYIVCGGRDVVADGCDYAVVKLDCLVAMYGAAGSVDNVGVLEDICFLGR